MNIFALSGRLTRDPKLKNSRKGTQYTIVGIANNDTRSDNLFFDVMVFGVDAENICKYLSKGDSAAFNGHIEKSEEGYNFIADVTYFEQKAKEKVVCSECKRVKIADEDF